MVTVYQLYAGIDEAFRRHFDGIHRPALSRLPGLQGLWVHPVSAITDGPAADTRFIVEMRFADRTVVERAMAGPPPACPTCQALGPIKTVLVSEEADEREAIIGG